MKNKKTKIIVTSFIFILFFFEAKSQPWVELEKAIDSTFISVSERSGTTPKFTEIITKDSLYKISILYNELRPRLYFNRLKHLTLNIRYQGKDEKAFKNTYDNLLSTLCTSISKNKNQNGYEFVCSDDVVDTYIYVDKKANHIHYENYVKNHTDKSEFKKETIYSNREELKGFINEYRVPLIDTLLEEPRNKRWTKIEISQTEGELYCDIIEYLGEKNSSGYYSRIGRYRLKLSELTFSNIKFTKSIIKGHVICEFEKNIIEYSKYDSDSEVVNSESTNKLSTIGSNNNIVLTKELFASIERYFNAFNRKK